MTTPNDVGPAREKTLRDEFAMAALQGMAANTETGNAFYASFPTVDSVHSTVAAVCYKMADAMISEREKEASKV